ncbi:unnamed protein product [Thlaspi arvense]|uniref:DRBM domain-containing protein n=1 Tax=Thlaspi arvense TaxID=13288 RepID=A0AAU9RB47_THLAR|nr:unnamed protein product [Thlaspi arvense]
MYLPPLDPSSIPTSSSARPIPRMMLQRCENGSKMRKLNDDVVEEDNNTLQIQPNITHANEKNLVLAEPEPEPGLVPYTQDPTTQVTVFWTQKVSAKEQLYTLCGVRHWKAPAYDCSDQDGPCNVRLFMVKVTVEMKEDSRITVLECFGDPQNKKKIAAEQAAEAALWYLKNAGYTLQTGKASGRRRRTKPVTEDDGNRKTV